MSRLLLAVALLAPVVASAAPEPTLRALTAPDPEAPTEVWIGLDDFQVFSIREQDEVFVLGGRLSLQWIDPRQAFDPAAAGTFQLDYQGEAAEDKLDGDMWWPRVEFADAIGSRDRSSVSLTLTAEGRVWYRERFLVDIKQNFYLDDFPYDSHGISFTVEPVTHGSSVMRFVTDESSLGTASWEPTEWVVDAPVLEVDDGVGHLCRGTDGGEEGPFEGGCGADAGCAGGSVCEEVYGYPRMTVSMDISRVASHYNGNIILPMILIVLIASAVFWIDLERAHLGDRLTLSFTSLLTVVAFDFVTSGSLPKLWYSTVLDHIVTASYVFLAINIALSIVIDRLAAGERHAHRGRRLDRLMRWIYPLAYLVCIAVLIFGAG